MTAPHPEGRGVVAVMRNCLENAGLKPEDVDHINTHGTSTPIGDVKELEAIKETFGNDVPPMSSTKSITGHSLGAVSAQEAVFCLLMMEHGFMAESANIENLDEKAKDLPILRKVEKKELNCVMSNSFGFGGTNSTLVFEKV